MRVVEPGQIEDHGGEPREEALSASGEKPTVAVAGATGFLGTELAVSLSEHYRLVGLTRGSRTSLDNYDEVRQVDLMSRKAANKALVGVDHALYLVHSMMPSARLVQANFRDLDAICADNFARAAAQQGVQKIIYVGGLQPVGSQRSEHLESRLEVEEILGAYGVQVVVLRAGLVVGGKGSSFQILTRLVRRLPVMVCPSWTRTKTQPVALPDVVWALEEGLKLADGENRVFDLGGAEPLSYRELMSETAELMGKKRLMIPVPLVSPGLSRLWVTLVTGAPRGLVGPLVESLRHEMLARESEDVRLPNEPGTSIRDMLEAALQEERESSMESPRAFQPPPKKKQAARVLSVQRMTLPEGADAEWAAQQYGEWLPRLMGGLMPIHVVNEEPLVRFHLFKGGPVLLRLERLPEVGASDRQVYRVRGGLLAKSDTWGRLEFRQVLDEQTLIVAVHDFEPRLPWWIYRSTQAVFHAWIMRRFTRYLLRHPRVELERASA